MGELLLHCWVVTSFRGLSGNRFGTIIAAFKVGFGSPTPPICFFEGECGDGRGLKLSK
jgi:hypothetical protein